MTPFFVKHKKSLFYSLSAFLMVAMLTLANFLAGFIIPASGESEEISVPAYQLYLISLSQSQLKNEALAHASDFQSMGAGGYVWQNEEYYHIISSGYFNKADCELVQSSIKLNQGLDTTLLSISIPSYSIYGSFDSDQHKTLSALLAAPLNFYHSIYDIAISTDTNVLNEVGAKLNVNNALHDYATTISNFNTIFTGTLEKNIASVYKMTTKGYEIAQKLALGEKKNEEQNYSSLLKYRYLEILNLYYNFVCNP